MGRAAGVVASVLACVAVAIALASPAARAETVTLKTEMNGGNEVPPNSSAARGTAEALLDTVTLQLSWTVIYSGLDVPLTGMHFHAPAEAGRNAGIVVRMQGDLTSPVRGGTTLNRAQAEDLLAGRWYLNIHTERHPGGEIRGQMLR